MYAVRTGCARRQLPADFPPWQTVYRHFVRWEEQGVTQRIPDALRRRVRGKAGRDPEPSAAVIDGRSVKAAGTVGAGTRGYDASKKINGRKRFVAVDTLGLLLAVMVRPAGVQDRAGATPCCRGCTCPVCAGWFSPIGVSPGGWWSGRAGCRASLCTSWPSPPAGAVSGCILGGGWSSGPWPG